MSLIILNILKAKAEAEKFLDLCDNALNTRKESTDWFLDTSKHTGALKRSSMDLSRSLSALRANKVTDRNA